MEGRQEDESPAEQMALTVGDDLAAGVVGGHLAPQPVVRSGVVDIGSAGGSSAGTMGIPDSPRVR